MPIVFRKPGNYSNTKHYPQGGKKRRPGRGIRQIQKLTQDVAQIKQAVNVEYKYYDAANPSAPSTELVPIATANAPNAAITMLENNIPQGVGSTQREGDTIRIKSYHHKCILTNQNAAPVRVRMVVFLYLRPTQTGTTPSVSDVLEVVAAGNFNPMVAPRNLDNRSRFKILIDKSFALEPTGTIGEQRVIDIFKKFDFHTQWPATSSGHLGTTITKNALYCMYFQDGGNNGSNTNVRMYCFSRIRYIDN